MAFNIRNIVGSVLGGITDVANIVGPAVTRTLTGAANIVGPAVTRGLTTGITAPLANLGTLAGRRGLAPGGDIVFDVPTARQDVQTVGTVIKGAATEFGRQLLRPAPFQTPSSNRGLVETTATGRAPSSSGPGFVAPTPATGRGTPIPQFDTGGRIVGFTYPLGVSGTVGGGSQFFQGGTGISGITGGGATVPGSLTGGFGRAAGGSLGFNPEEEERNRRNIFGTTAQATGQDIPFGAFQAAGDQQVDPLADIKNLGGLLLEGLGKLDRFVAGGDRAQVAPSDRRPITAPGQAPGEQVGGFDTGQVFGDVSGAVGQFLQPGQRTFGRIGGQVFETTGGQFKLVGNAEQSGIDPNTLPELGKENLNEAQQQDANRLARQNGQAEPFPKTPTTEFREVTADELTEPQPKVDLTTLTEKQYDSHITQKLETANTGAPSISGFNQNSGTNANNQVYKSWNPDAIDQRTGEKGAWDVFNADGTPMDLKTFQELDLNIDHINTAASIQEFGDIDISPENILEFDPNRQIVSKDSELQKQADNLQTQIDELRNSPLGDIAVTGVDGLRAQIREEVGLSGLYEESLENKTRMNEIFNEVDLTRAEIEDDPDFSRTLKNRRVTHLTNKSQALLNALIRSQELINDRITNAERTVTQRMSDAVTNYNIYNNQLNSLQNSYDKVQARVDKIGENAQQTFQFIASNPEMIRGVPQKTLKEWFTFVEDNGYLPQDMVARIGENTGRKAQSILRNDLTGEVFGTDGNDIWKIGSIGVAKAATAASPFTNVRWEDNGDGTFTAIAISKATNQPVFLGNISAGEQSKSFLINQYTKWLQKNKGVYEEGDLTAVLGSIPVLSTISTIENKPVFDLISAFSKGDVGSFFGKKDPQGAIASFTEFILVVKIQNPVTGEIVEYSDPNEPEIQEAINDGWIKI